MAGVPGTAASLQAGSGMAGNITSAQLVQQLSQVIGKDGLRPHGLLQAFANGIANRPRCLVIHLFKVTVDPGIHGDSPRRSVVAEDERNLARSSHHLRICFRAQTSHAIAWLT
jgi:hypothetical protein